MSVVIVLTTTVYPQNKCFIYQSNYMERIKSYLKSIHQWIEHTLLPIIVVENSGYTFPELKHLESDRFRIVTFNESIDAPHLVGNNSKGASELWSIKNIKKYILPFDYIIKITGRYFIPHFEKWITQLNETDVVRQNTPLRCEVIGCNIKHFDYFFNDSILINGKECNHIEFLYQHRLNHFDKTLIFPEMPIEPTCMGGIEKILNSL
jgi:hypothetical protein